MQEQEDINRAMQFTLCQEVVVGIPPAWVELADKAWGAGKNYRPVSKEHVAQLRAMADKAPSVFKSRREVARHNGEGLHRFDRPHAGCAGVWAQREGS